MSTGQRNHAAMWRMLALAAAALLLPRVVAWADVRDTKHNLARTEGGQVSVDSRDVCVFCHTPTVAASAAAPGDAAPLWQQAVPADFGFLTYDDIGRSLPGDRNTVGSQSIACLSCHDTAQAFPVGQGTRDHPFGVPYRGIGADATAREAIMQAQRQVEGARFREAEFLRDEKAFRPAHMGMINNRTIWWASSGQQASLRRGKNDLPLYSRRDPSGAEVPFIECSSCHDPHNDKPLFLRVSAGSALCLTCHTK